MRMEKSILDILGMSLFQTTLSDFLEGLKSVSYTHLTLPTT